MQALSGGMQEWKRRGGGVARARALQPVSMGVGADCGEASDTAARKAFSLESQSVEEGRRLGDNGHPVAVHGGGRRGGTWGVCAVAAVVLARFLHRNKPWCMRMLVRGLHMLRQWVGRAAAPSDWSWLAAGGGARGADRWVGRLEMAVWVLAFRLLWMCRRWCSSSVVRELRQSE